MRSCCVNALLCFLAASCILASAWPSRTNATCPVLQRCYCASTSTGVIVKCIDIPNSQEVSRDIAKLEGVTVRKLLLVNTSLNELPTKGLNNVRSIHFKETTLNSLPSCLSGAKGLRYIRANKHTFKVLQGSLSCPELRHLFLRYNSIDVVNEEYLTAVPKLEVLVLSNNNIQHLSPLLFKKTPHLTDVRISSNRFTALNGLFDGMRYLQTINLGINMITDINVLSKSRMPNLKEINLSKNRIEVIPAFASTNSMIKVLRFSENQISDIEPGAFNALQRLCHLDLSKNKISYLNGSAFGTVPNLEYLNLSGNKLFSVTGLFTATPRIKELKLSSNRITSITNVFHGLRNLRTLSINYNLVRHIPDDNFKDNTHLLELNLSYNNIQWLGRNAFRGLVAVTTLHLRRNQLLSLNGSIRHLQNLKYFDAAKNQIQRLENGEFGGTAFLRFVYLMENNISNVEGAFTGAVHLKFLELQRNRIELLRRSDFPRRTTATPEVRVEHNPLMCDCRLAWLVRPDSGVRLTRNPTCENPHWLKGASLDSLKEENLVAWKDGCEPACKCTCREEHGNIVTVVNCSSAAMNRPPSVFPINATELHLRNNHLEELNEYLKKGAPDLEVLCLKNNRISSLNLSVLPDKVRSLDLSGNRLKKLPHDLVLAFNLTSLRLSSNPFQCDCNDYSFRQWVEAHVDVVRDAEHILCEDSFNAHVSQKAFMTLGKNQLCPVSSPADTTYLPYLLGVVVVILAVSAACLHGERRLKLWLRTRRVCSWLQCSAEGDLDAEKLFDVFLSFSSKDAAWVHEQLLPELEAAGVSYCTYERNFKVGFLLQDTIRDAVACSRRTLLLVTRNFVTSEWCRLEFRFAHHKALEDNINRVIIVLVDEMAVASLDEDLRLYMRAANYLCWGEPNFWDRLFSSMPKMDSKKKLISHKRAQPTFAQTGAIQ